MILGLKVSAILIFFAFLFGLCDSGSKPARKGVSIKGNSSYEASIYRQNCAICHGPEAYGKTVDGKPVPGLRFGAAAEKTEEEIYQQIAHGKLPMPSFNGQLTESEMRRMAKFVFQDLQARASRRTTD